MPSRKYQQSAQILAMLQIIFPPFILPKNEKIITKGNARIVKKANQISA
jgi:hypothetical protein